MATSKPQKYVIIKIPVFWYSKKLNRYIMTRYLIQLLIPVYCRTLVVHIKYIWFWNDMHALKLDPKIQNANH